MKKRRYFGLIPAAGQSRRMGTHKLLMPWRADKVIDAVLQAWMESIADPVLIVVRGEDQQLVDACHAHAVEVIQLDSETLDMKHTIQRGLRIIEENWDPLGDDVCLIAPADLPTLSSGVIDSVAGAVCVSGSQFVTPMYGEKNGHPVAFRWKIAQKIFELGDEEGLNVLISRSSVSYVHLDVSLRPRDIDTPADYRRELE